jgi:uncharacterized membrane protein YdjX (TVP38/TMEM64 family)
MSLVSTALFLADQARLLGPVLGPLFFTVALTGWVVVCLPCTIIEMIPGFLFGIKTGWVVSMAGKSIGSAISMYLGRYVFKDATERFVFSRYPILRKLGIAAEREGFPFLLFVRGMWLPIALKNYGLAVLNVSIPEVLLAGFLTSIPHSLLWAWIGSRMNNVAEVIQGSGKISITDVIPGRDLLIVGTPIAILCIIVARNFYRRFSALINEED